jgi:hypothetical protein
MKKDFKQLTKRLRKEFGITLVHRGQHQWLVGPDGKLVATISSSASDVRALKNVKSDVRRAGYRIK